MQTITLLLVFYGIFLITCGIVSVLFIGFRAKTALVSGGVSGLVSVFIGWLMSTETPGAPVSGIALALALSVVFAWRSAKTLFRLFDMIPERSEELRGKGIAFLIISLMAVVSVVTLMIQVIHFWD